jgi:hypothetical protein
MWFIPLLNDCQYGYITKLLDSESTFSRIENFDFICLLLWNYFMWIWECANISCLDKVPIKLFCNMSFKFWVDVFIKVPMSTCLGMKSWNWRPMLIGGEKRFGTFFLGHLFFLEGPLHQLPETLFIYLFILDNFSFFWRYTWCTSLKLLFYISFLKKDHLRDFLGFFFLGNFFFH